MTEPMEELMRRNLWLILTIALSSPAAIAHEFCGKAECAAVKEKIQTIESQLRAGYTIAQGKKYKAKLRELRARRSKLCR